MSAFVQSRNVRLAARRHDDQPRSDRLIRLQDQTGAGEGHPFEDETGQTFWIYRSGDGIDPETGSHRWFMHGIFA
ncbi:hypothetical protein PY650_20900 [Rhizobium calliandrae]|uniref:Uncharacterized protein n=1 Tax=Rhizobium calliandrae TaxID=1312182 RepID=A0ABT7KHG1_9HYPH|nr:hypothetical protein [Rhizobium calliandrae]MDL2408074.1 hypothetical protein [Rhizobium calliandrae]